MSRDYHEHAEPLTFSEWCCQHEEVFGFIRTVCALIGTVVVIIILLEEIL